MFRPARSLLFLACAVVLAACAAQRAAPPDGAPADAAEAPLVTSLHVEPFPDSVALTLQVTNTSTEPVVLTFPTGQSYDFVVEQGAREAWRWSGDRVFTQAVRTETLAPGRTLRFQATWQPAARDSAQEFTAVGYLTTLEYRGEQRARFHLP